MDLLDLPEPRQFVLCRMPLSVSRTSAPAKVWHTCLVLGVTQDYEGRVLVTLAGTTSKVSGLSSRVQVRAETPEGRAAGAVKDFELCCEWTKVVPLTAAFFGDSLTVKGVMTVRLSALLKVAVGNLTRRYQ